MAMFLLYRSVAFAEDIEVEASTDFPKFYAEANREYSNVSITEFFRMRFLHTKKCNNFLKV